jgi:hypothetical protein
MRKKLVCDGEGLARHTAQRPQQQQGACVGKSSARCGTIAAPDDPAQESSLLVRHKADSSVAFAAQPGLPIQAVVESTYAAKPDVDDAG